MFQFILGAGGSGKTFTLVERIDTLLKDDPQAQPILLVPEQFSYETEKLLLARVGAENAMRVKVYGFTRFAEMLLRESGKTPKKPLDEGTRFLLLNQTLQETADRRRLPFRAGNAGQLSLLSDILKEWKQNAVTHEMLADVKAKLPADCTVLKQKLDDLDVVQEAFSTLVYERFDDPQDWLTQAYDFLRETPTACAGLHLFLDGFMGFTVQEERLLSCLFSRAASVTVTLCVDPATDTDGMPGLFLLPEETERRLKRLAQEAGMTVAAPVRLFEDKRHEGNEPLRALCEGMFRPFGDTYEAREEAEKTAVTVIACADKSEECKAAAREIRFAMRERGMRCREIAVVVRDLDAYAGALKMALQSEDVPFYLDARESIRGEALIETVVAALCAVGGYFHTEDILRLLKTGLPDVSAEEIAALENYAYQWSVSGGAWTEEFTFNPAGLSAKLGEEEQARLTELNVLRRKVMEPLLRLKTALTGETDGTTFAKAVYAYLETIGAPQQTKERICALEETGYPALADRTERVWDATMALLDTFAKGGTQRQTVAAWTELFMLTANATELGAVPQGLDAVQVGSADRIRLSAPKLVFLLGANEGVFPAVPSAGGYLSTRERKTLQEQGGLTLSKHPERELTEEWLYAYNAVCAAREMVYITYAQSDLAGEALSASLIVTEVERLLTGYRHTAFCTSETWMPETPAEAMRYYTATYRAPTSLTTSVGEVLRELPEQQVRLEALERAAAHRSWSLSDEALSKRLFNDGGRVDGGTMTLSASKIDTYYSCPFRYFCRYGLHIQDRQRAELNAMESGTLIHAVLETLVPRYREQGFKAVSYEQVREDVAQAVDAHVTREMGGLSDKSPRFLYLLTRLKRLALSVTWHLVQEFCQSDFLPADFELEIGTHAGALLPMTLQLKDGSTVRLKGKIDRVDVFKKDDVTYVRVVDYKTGAKSFSLSDVVGGLNLQMLLYLFTIWENGKSRYADGGEIVPAGVLYLPAQLPIVSAKATEDERVAAQRKALKMDGLVLDDVEVATAMEKELAGMYVPVRSTKPGSGKLHGSWSKLATYEQFYLLNVHAKRLLSEMAEELHRGNVPAKPAERGNPCGYCEYHTVCGFENGCETRAFDYFPPNMSGETAKMRYFEETETAASSAES